MATRTASSQAPQRVADKRTAYFAALAPGTRRVVKQMRATIRTAVPDAVESFSYGIPGFQLDGRPLIWYAGFTKHTSLFPMTAEIRAAHSKALVGYRVSTGTVQFPLHEPLPTKLVERLVKARVAAMRAARRSTAKKRRQA